MVGASSAAAPWQFKWKRPRWEPVNEVKPEPGTPIAHAAAALHPSELVAVKSASSTDSSSLPPSSGARTLTVTLLQSQQQARNSSSSSSSKLADVVVLKVIQQKQKKRQQSEEVVLQSRVLRWPTTEDITSRDVQTNEAAEAYEGVPDLSSPNRETDVMMNCYEPIESCIQNNPLLALLSLGRRRGRSNSVSSWSSPARSRRNPQHGLVAAAFVRRSRDAAGEKTNATFAAAAGGETNDESSSLDELVLACLSSRGKVHFYNPWTLLGGEKSKRNAPSNSEEELEESMASFLFGRSLLTTVQETILPLSQPEQTLKLSLPFLQRVQQPSTIAEGLEDSEEHEGGDPQKKMQPFLSFLDASSWSSVLDAATLPFQTIQNVPTLCVAALDFLVVAGKGRQRWKQTNHHHHGAVGAGEPESSSIEPSESQLEESDSQVDDSSVRSGQGSVRRPSSRRKSDGGFVTFISLQSYSETRTVFVPFVPHQISPFLWGSMQFLLVMGQGQAVAIHMETTSVVAVRKGEAPSGNDPDGGKPEAVVLPDHHPRPDQQAKIPIHPFEVLPIDLSGSDRASHILVGSEVTVSPPGIAILFQDSHTGEIFVVQRLLNAIDLVRKENMSIVFQDYGPQSVNDEMPAITTAQEVRHAANTPSLRETALWCHLGQGWCILGCASKVCFVCFEGSNSESGAYLYELTSDQSHHDMSRSIISSVLPVRTARTRTTTISSGAQSVRLPFTGPLSSPPVSMDNIVMSRPGSIRTRPAAELDDIVVQAMDSISHLSYRESVADHPPSSPSKKAFTFSHQEKSIRLLRNCTSWTKLEQSPQAPPRFEAQTPVLSVQTKSGTHFALSLRAAALEHGHASPFQEVLAWLSQQEEDFFTAASLALDLLRDSESLRHLWRAFDKIDDDTERSKLEGLLDGIVPIYSRETNTIDENSPLWSTLRRLADMTVGCLTKGGYRMSSTLEQFLARNENYDPSRASLMLVAMAANAVSDDPYLVESVMGKDYEMGEAHLQLILWPVQCLLQVGVARNHLMTALTLLNTTIPDELRRRDRGGVVSTSIPSMEMCKSLVSLVVASSPDATEILLDLVDEKTRCRFWDSLEHETRLKLSLLCVNDKLPLILDPEVRAWGLKQLDKCIAWESSPSAKDISTALPTPWLCELVTACLRNAGCDLETLLDPHFEGTEKDPTSDDGIAHYGEEVVKTRRALVPAPASGGLDFGLVIPALLVLEHRGTLWHAESKTSTRSLLNAACYMAGRRSVEESLFTLNGSTLMRQCTLVNDIEAGAHLIGGQNGLVLECSHVIINALEIDMDAAEDFLLSGHIPSQTARKVEDTPNPFVIRDSHRRILWLLEEHVLKVRTYGEFERGQLRGKIDPVFAATVCFRTWWLITLHQNLAKATEWLTAWLRRKLSLSEKTATSPHRLVCAALVRALVWPEKRDDAVDAILAYKLQLDSSFVVQLSQSCCGLVEAIPDYIAAEDLKKVSKSKASVPAKQEESGKGTTGSLLEF